MLQKVGTTGVDLDSVYDRTLQRIREQKGDRSRLGIEVLMWISHAERPLRIDELCHALAVERGTADIDPENIRPQDTVLGSCLGLVIMDMETMTVRLIHHTLQEYLSQPGILLHAHNTLARSCLAYLNYDRVKGLPANTTSNLGEMPFLEYSSFYWGTHAKMELSDSAKTLALQLLDRYDSHISSTLLFNQIHGYHTRPPAPHLFTGIHSASYFGIDQVMAILVERKSCDINQGDCMGRTPLMWAARQGNQGAVRLLLRCDDVNPDKPDNNGLTPLHRASSNGHQGVVGLLLARDDVNPDKLNNYGQTPLWVASRQGQEEVVRLLLSRDDVNADRPDNNGQTPLNWSSWNGHEGVVRLLLARDDVDPDKPDNYGQTPLWGASFNGHEEVVRLLLTRGDVNPDKPDNYGQTPLWCASWDGREGVVRLLLARGDVNPDKPDSYGLTPLWGASCNGEEGVVKLLLARRDVYADRQGDNGQTPLYRASWNGHEGVVRLLLAQGDVNLGKPDKNGQTPLGAASVRGHMGIVALLQRRAVVISSPGRA